MTSAEEEGVEIGIKYKGFIKRQERQVQRLRSKTEKQIPPEVDYSAMLRLSAEAREHLTRVRPKNIGQASMIGGVTPVDISILLVYLEVENRKQLIVQD